MIKAIVFHLLVGRRRRSDRPRSKSDRSISMMERIWVNHLEACITSRRRSPAQKCCAAGELFNAVCPIARNDSHRRKTGGFWQRPASENPCVGRFVSVDLRQCRSGDRTKRQMWGWKSRKCQNFR
ncbi:MAG: hypothetical protein JGK31_34255 [Microcoleus sp. PH2017_30_WIL_O_A]|nr:hypothetical protein [Microcoleus sp. PH2017_30_WIL_O_A]